MHKQEQEEPYKQNSKNQQRLQVQMKKIILFTCPVLSATLTKPFLFFKRIS